MLKNLSFIAILGIAAVGVPSELSAKSVKVAGTQKGVAAKSITRQVAQQNVTIEFYSPSIVRILKSDAGLGALVQKKSYSVILKPQQLKDVQIQENGDVVNVKSKFICVELNQQTGEIRFLSKDGKLLLTDTKTRLEARKDEANKGKYRIEQDFRLADDEAIYGLGQLRDVYMNQRGRQNIELWNHNTYIAIPYFTSEKGYGLYWDNAGKIATSHHALPLPVKWEPAPTTISCTRMVRRMESSPAFVNSPDRLQCSRNGRWASGNAVSAIRPAMNWLACWTSITN